MWAATALQRRRSSSLSHLPSYSLSLIQQWKSPFLALNHAQLCSSLAAETNNNNIIINNNKGLLNLEEVEKVLNDVKADNVTVIPVNKHCEFTDYMVVATGRSPWHVRNIAQAIVYMVKQKQKGAKRMLLPSVEGQEGGKWIVVDSGTLIVHALDEKVRAYYNLERLWTTETSNNEQSQELEKAFVKVRRKNNSKKRVQSSG